MFLFQFYQCGEGRDDIFLCVCFSFTSVVKGGMIFEGVGTVSIGGGDQIWLAVNKTLLLEVNVKATDVGVPCKKVDLSPAAQTGSCFVFVKQTTIITYNLCVTLHQYTFE